MVKKTSGFILLAFIALLTVALWAQQAQEIPDAPSASRPVPPPTAPSEKTPAAGEIKNEAKDDAKPETPAPDAGQSESNPQQASQPKPSPAMWSALPESSHAC